MKENINIEELFKQKFDSFQPEVDPSVWAGVQSQLGATTAATTVATSTIIKSILIGSGIIAASVITWYVGFYEPETAITTSNNVTNNTEVQTEQNAPENNESVIIVSDTSDPIIKENKEEIERELRNYQNQNETNNTVPNQSTINNSSVNVNNSNNSTNQIGSTNSNDNSDNSANNIVIGDDVDQDKAEPKAPTGRMEFAQSGVYAPSLVEFNSNAQNYKEVKWDFGDGTTGTGLTSKHTYSKPGNYTVKLTVVGADKQVFEERQEITVKSKSSVDNIPNVITPNGDRINDYFFVKTTDIETFYISIRDGQGNEIFTSNDKDFSWDGSDFSGETVEKGMYSYIIIAEGKDGSVIKIPGQIYVQ